MRPRVSRMVYRRPVPQPIVESFSLGSARSESGRSPRRIRARTAPSHHIRHRGDRALSPGRRRVPRRPRRRGHPDRQGRRPGSSGAGRDDCRRRLSGLRAAGRAADGRTVALARRYGAAGRAHLSAGRPVGEHRGPSRLPRLLGSLAQGRRRPDAGPQHADAGTERGTPLRRGGPKPAPGGRTGAVRRALPCGWRSAWSCWGSRTR